MSDISTTADDSRYQPIYPGRPGESLDDYLRRANASFAAALSRNPTPIPRFISVQDIANRGSGGRY